MCPCGFHVEICACCRGKLSGSTFQIRPWQRKGLPFLLMSRSFGCKQGPVIAACGWEHALHLMLLMKKRNIQQNQVTLNAALHACEKSGRWAEALVLLQSFSPARPQRVGHEAI